MLQFSYNYQNLPNEQPSLFSKRSEFIHKSNKVDPS